MTTLVTLEARRTGTGCARRLRAELTKLPTLRSTLWTLAATVRRRPASPCSSPPTGPATTTATVQGFDPTNEALTGLAIGTLIMGVLGVLVATGEYGTGTIRSSLAATPRRPLLLGAKVAVVGALTLVVGEVLTFACFFIGQASCRPAGRRRRPSARPACSGRWSCPESSWPCWRCSVSGWA